MTFDQVLSWAFRASPGEQLIYHKGKQLANFQNKHDYSDAVWGARHCYNSGTVELTQRKDGSQFFYIATRKRVISPPKRTVSLEGHETHLFSIPTRFYRKDCREAA